MIVLSETVNMPPPVYSSGGRPEAKPGLSMTPGPGGNFAVLHLTRGKSAIIAGAASQTPAAAAIEFTASVDVQKQPSDNPGDWEFNFIQLIYQPVLRMTYAGFNRDGGSMVLTMSEAKPQYRLDNSDPATAPFPHRNPPIESAGSAARTRRFENSFIDHPNIARIPLLNPNFVTGKNNWLVRAQRSVFFFTAFVTRDTLHRISNDYIPLAYVDWYATWDATIKYSGGDPPAAADAVMTVSQFSVGNVVTKYPPRDMAKMIEQPTTNASDMFGTINTQQISAALSAMSNNRNCQASPGWPSDFTPILLP